ncbi:ParB/RepB/Spo0J family partition protein [Trueperella bialowiezensis]|uniref:Probable chromosome-partitioning protein parB n=1 Tax=Trueperella bialowiezensis TaxID=312285 RepID=A0A3S4WGF2_9ACTO|nr:ParB/RepB/Spo0J family partition protein [Trueperella bialowiezensis]VEI13340.1 Probable chromosome-partitioning protein parB [Trueperella bialowiezensis]
MAEKRRGLGRGLGALFPEEQKENKSRAIDIFFSAPQSDDEMPPSANTPTSAESTPATVETQNNSAESDDIDLVPVPGATFGDIPVEQIMPNPRQPREIFDDDELQELADSIKEVGVLQPIVIRPMSEESEDYPEARYELIMGERRWRATQRAGLDTIPAIIRQTDDSDLLRDALLENLHRSNLNALEEAAAYQQLLEDFDCTQEELSRRIARSRPQISNTLRLLNLPPLVQNRVAAGVLSAGHARALLGLRDPAAMERLAQRIVAEGLSVRQVEEIVAVGDDQAAPRTRRSRGGRHQEELNELALRLSDRFNTRVKVNLGVTKGKIAIEFATIEDLNRILGELNEDEVEI